MRICLSIVWIFGVMLFLPTAAKFIEKPLLFFGYACAILAYCAMPLSYY